MTAMTAGELRARLRRHYIPPEARPGGVFLEELTHGSHGGRRIDALFIGFYASRGRFMVGHELKVSRSDWVHELEQHDKAEAWVMDTHSWYVVAPSEDIVRKEELPHGWGLMVVDPRTTTRMRIVVKAADHPERQPSWDAMHSIVQAQEYRSIANMDAVKREATQTIDSVGRAMRLPYQKKTYTLAQLEERANELGQNGSAAEYQAQLKAEKQVVKDICELLGIDGIGRDETWQRINAPTVTGIRESFARFLQAEQQELKALGTKRQQLGAVITQLEEAASELRLAEQMIQEES